MKYCSSLLIMLVLVGCSGQQEDDIDQFIKGPVVGARGKVDPLPEVKQFVPYVFNADSTLPDPFAPRKANVEKSKEGKLQPDLKRPKEALEAFALENLKYVGTLRKGSVSQAMIGAPDGQVYQVKAGNYMGQNFGLITKITADEILIKEIVQDASGDWVERQVPIYPQEETQVEK